MRWGFENPFWERLDALWPSLLLAPALAIPFVWLLPRAKLSPWLALVAAVPVGAVILLWVVALRARVGDGR